MYTHLCLPALRFHTDGEEGNDDIMIVSFHVINTSIHETAEHAHNFLSDELFSGMEVTMETDHPAVDLASRLTAIYRAYFGCSTTEIRVHKVFPFAQYVQVGNNARNASYSILGYNASLFTETKDLINFNTDADSLILNNNYADSYSINLSIKEALYVEDLKMVTIAEWEDTSNLFVRNLSMSDLGLF